MRDAACASWQKLVGQPDFIFLTGDLGFNALEPLKEKAGSRFVNAGISEQNMVSVAAGLAKTGFRPWVYSIAPFIYARPFEQIRNDLCLNPLPVQLVGNGGGFGYGVMGPTHHAIEDYGTLLTLPSLKVWVPAFDEDVWPCVQAMSTSPTAGYLRLGRSEKPESFEVASFVGWRKLVSGRAGLVVSIGPIAGSLISPSLSLPESERPEIWAVGELPVEFEKIPGGFLEALKTHSIFFVLEEHVVQGSLGQMLVHSLCSNGFPIPPFHHLAVRGYVTKQYGSQTFHRNENGLEFCRIRDVISKEVNSG